MHADAIVTALFLPLAAGLVPVQGVTQDERWYVRREVRHERYGAELTVIGDVDGDGVADVASSAMDLAHWEPGNPAGDDLVRIQSGATLDTIGEIRSATNLEFGIDLAAVGDEDGDGVRDLAVMEADFDTGDGRVSIWSPRTRTLLREQFLPTGLDARGGGVDSLDDRDGDGREELLVALPSLLVASGVYGRFLLIGSSDGATLATWNATTGSIAVSGSWSAGHDFNGDGTRDLLFSERNWPSGAASIVVRIFSGSDYSPLAVRTITASKPLPLGMLDANLDMNADGRDDVALLHDGQLLWLSGVDLKTFRSRSFAASPAPMTVAGLGDADGDGKGDVAVATETDYSDDFGGTYTATLSVYGATGLQLYLRTESGTRSAFEERWFVLARDAPIDADLDGRTDLAYAWSDPSDDEWGPFYGQRIEIYSTHRHTSLAVREVEDLSSPDYVGHRILDDLDDDGVTETVTIENEYPNGVGAQFLALRRGDDGQVVWRRPIAVGAFNLPPIDCYGVVPDADGDGDPDLVTPADDASFATVVRSSRDGSVLRTLAGMNAYSIVARAATRPDAAGSFLVALARPREDPDHSGANGTGVVTAFRLLAGTEAWSVTSTTPGELGWDVETVGDFNGDGTGDFAVAAWNAWWIVDGNDGTKLATLPLASGQFASGGNFRFAPDDDGDGVSHLVVVSAAPSGTGDTNVYELPSLAKVATRPFLRLRNHALVSDLDLDGVPDLVGSDFTSTVVLSTATLQEIGRLPNRWQEFQSFRDPSLPRDFGGSDLHLLAMRNFRRPGISLLALPDLFMKSPAGAVVGNTVTIDVAGGQPGQLVGLYVVEVDGVAIDQFAAFDVLDAGGKRSFSDVILPDAAGTQWLLRSFTIGLDGRLARSNHELLSID